MSRVCSSCWPRLARCAEHLLTSSSVRLWRRIAETAVAALPQEGALLDLGCGTGTVLRFIREERFDAHLVGIDIDPPSLAKRGRRSIRPGP